MLSQFTKVFCVTPSLIKPQQLIGPSFNFDRASTQNAIDQFLRDDKLSLIFYTGKIWIVTHCTNIS